MLIAILRRYIAAKSAAGETSTRSYLPNSRARIVIIEIRWNRSPDLVEQAAGAVAIAPRVDVVPIDTIPLKGDHAPSVVLFLEAARPHRPEQSGHDHVLDGRHPDRPER